MTITVQQIQYTTEPDAWHALAVALGLDPVPGGDDSWSEFAGDGLLAVHRVATTADERTEITLRTDDLDALAATLTTVGAVFRRVDTDDLGTILVVDAPIACTVTTTSAAVASAVSAAVSAASASGSGLTVLPVWYGQDLDGPAAVLEALSLRRRLSSDSGVWIDFTAAGGGGVALHRADRTGVELSFEYGGDLDALAARLRSGGWTGSVVDEAYNRTLRVARPDGPDLWVNGRQDDLYGYTRAI
ncbi:hypothetical protein [Curtobacterium sp. ISL-83]|uniref:hypothetical protein n=1 Tax=Curtobacterium sp. ISL-83 TaxID=2819145 RepID=UPI001BE884E6|nr:hypothetical protein [Curtobacterium sp. ISL-83]MBT2501440.1 hypothetical protein [Curtobacterium sp. ISL-83]